MNMMKNVLLFTRDMKHKKFDIYKKKKKLSMSNEH